MPPSLLVNRCEVVLGSFLVEYVFPSSVDVRIVLLSRSRGVDVVLEFDNLLYEGSTCCWLVYPGLSSAFVMGRLFCRFYRGMMSLPDVKEPLFVADGLCRRMFYAVMMVS